MAENENMVERVARAIQEALPLRPHDQVARHAARKAMEAIREPTEAMLAAVDCAGDKRGWLSGRMHVASWQAMIDAALTPEKGNG